MVTQGTLLTRLPVCLALRAQEALEEVRRQAAAQGWSLYLVGGGVRDLLLGRPQVDLDLALEGDAIALTKVLTEATGGRAIVHSSFGTATVQGQGFTMDLARTRREVYPRPGALPKVSPAPIEDDLARRDFTINTMALALSGPREGELLDPFGGRRDLMQGVIKVLHEKSFIDDATRILRALRYAGRLGFSLASRTRQLVLRDRDYLLIISGSRLRRELMLILAEERADAALTLAQELGVLSRLHPSLTFSSVEVAQARRMPTGECALVRLCLLAKDLSRGEAEALARRLALTKKERQALLSTAQLGGLVEELSREEVPASAVARLLEPYPLTAVWAFALSAPPPAAERALRYLEVWRHVKPLLNGKALQALGIPPGPALGRILQALREARLDGVVQTQEDEATLARQLTVGDATCPVCERPLDEVNVARCDICGRLFHFIVRRDRLGRDCGTCHLHPDYLALAFICNLCLQRMPAQG